MFFSLHAAISSRTTELFAGWLQCDCLHRIHFLLFFLFVYPPPYVTAIAPRLFLQTVSPPCLPRRPHVHASFHGRTGTLQPVCLRRHSWGSREPMGNCCNRGSVVQTRLVHLEAIRNTASTPKCTLECASIHSRGALETTKTLHHQGVLLRPEKLFIGRGALEVRKTLRRQGCS
jgi:hypothetical protein